MHCNKININIFSSEASVEWKPDDVQRESH